MSKSSHPTPERLKEIRDEIHSGYWKGPGQELLAAIDALRSERDSLKTHISIGGVQLAEACEERDQWRAYSQTLREALLVVVDSGYSPRGQDRAREALAIPKPDDKLWQHNPKTEWPKPGSGE